MDDYIVTVQLYLIVFKTNQQHRSFLLAAHTTARHNNAFTPEHTTIAYADSKMPLLQVETFVIERRLRDKFQQALQQQKFC